ncbi:hypothetical protein CGZ80_17355 [Rhodopirellula sp. MGV]|nr:hypothetical protein CGZ80_17355 [Rhodopirellula sp. MGV]PNY34073.1 hypothetical protein C2E31_25040 [Rhodopirellula baltica]
MVSTPTTRNFCSLFWSPVAHLLVKGTKIAFENGYDGPLNGRHLMPTLPHRGPLIFQCQLLPGERRVLYSSCGSEGGIGREQR